MYNKNLLECQVWNVRLVEVICHGFVRLYGNQVLVNDMDYSIACYDARLDNLGPVHRVNLEMWNVGFYKQQLVGVKLTSDITPGQLCSVKFFLLAREAYKVDLVIFYQSKHMFITEYSMKTRCISLRSSIKLFNCRYTISFYHDIGVVL